MTADISFVSYERERRPGSKSTWGRLTATGSRKKNNLAYDTLIYLEGVLSVLQGQHRFPKINKSQRKEWARMSYSDGFT